MFETFNVDLLIKQGITFLWTGIWGTGKEPNFVPHDLTGCTARMQIRETVESEVILLANGDGIDLALNTEPGEIMIGMTAATTEAIEWRNAVYDLEIVFPDTTVARVMEGKVQVSPGVTR